MSEVELQHIGSYPITTTLHTDQASTTYLSKQGKKTLLIKKHHTPLGAEQEQTAFLTRAYSLKKLSNRHTIKTIDAGFDDEYPYLVTHYQPGQSIYQKFTPSQQHASDEIRIILSAASTALNEAHKRHIIHGNLHPACLLITERNEVVLTDFAFRLPTLETPPLGEDVAIPYMAPEYLRGTPFEASDQYSLAVIIYELLCGRRPFEVSERADLLRHQEELPVPLPSTLNSRLSPYIDHVLMRALAREPLERFSHIKSFADNYIRALMHQPIQDTTPHITVAAPATSTPVPGATVQLQEPPTTPALSPVPVSPSRNKQETLTATTGLRITRRKQTEAEALAEAAKPAAQPQSLLLTTMESAPETQDQSKQDDQQIDNTETLRLYRQITADLCQGGILSRRLPGYEERPAQVEMARTVARALAQNVPAIIEAGTGTGKSLAYLLPVVRSNKVAIVSTANKALQEQLFYKDIPFIQQHIQPFEAALVKGVNNYVCIDRMENERIGMQFYTKNEQFQRLLDIVNDPDNESFTGDFETLDFQLPADVRGRVATDSDQCAWSKCTYFSDCYVRQMRERAERAQVIVVNHTLLLLDAAMGGFLLPERDVIILDEAHHLEEEATRSFTITISPGQIQTLLAQRMLKDHSQVSLQDEAFRAAQNMWMRLEMVADPGRKGRINLEDPLEEGLRLASALDDLADSLRKQRPKDLPEKENQLYDKLLKRAQNLAENVRTVFSVAEPEKFVYYVEREERGGRNSSQLQASASPLDITNWLKERLFNKCNVICTSATLATVNPTAAKGENRAANFSYFRHRVGLDPEERPEVQENILPLAFDYESNALLYLPHHLPAPTFGLGEEDYQLAIAREMYSLVKRSRGRAFLLFSSKRMLDFAYEKMAEPLEKELGLPSLKQGEMTRIELTRRFRQEKGSVLFGLKSFWEGVDIAGDALSLVVIDKLPFDPPDDPVHEARVAQMKARGENWFGTYVLPQAVLRLKQGIGRLLRTRTDTGVMAILDTRLHTKGYGKLVINALPPARRTSSLRDVTAFFTEHAPIA